MYKWNMSQVHLPHNIKFVNIVISFINVEVTAFYVRMALLDDFV
jgi:hypothetical protein